LISQSNPLMISEKTLSELEQIYNDIQKVTEKWVCLNNKENLIIQEFEKYEKPLPLCQKMIRQNEIREQQNIQRQNLTILNRRLLKIVGQILASKDRHLPTYAKQ